MGISGRDSSCDDSIRSQIRKMGPICKTRKKSTVEFQESSMEEDIDIDLDERLVQERFSDENECMWLSSASPSPSSFFQEYRLSSSLHLSVNKWVISWLSTLANSNIYIDRDCNSRVNPEEEKESTLSDKSYGNYASDFAIANSDSLRLSLTPCLEEVSSFDNSSTPSSTIFDSSLSSQISDFDRESFLVSLVNLDGEDSKLISDSELEMDYFPSGFPSPSCPSCNDNDSTPSKVVVDEHTRYGMFLEHNCSDSVDLEDISESGPLFWPSEWKQDWSSEETWKCFSMSPRKNTTKLGIRQETYSKSVEFRVRKMDFRKGCIRRLEFGSGSNAASKISSEEKQRSSINSLKKINSAARTNTPSRLRKSTKNTVKIVPLQMEDDIEEAKDKAFSISKSNYVDKGLLEDDIISNEELPIETLLGLGEFDGHEGVDSEFNEAIFSLDDSF